MITGKIRYIVSQVDPSGNTTYWGPFPDKETADQWDAMPNGNGSVYATEELRSAPQWFPGAPVPDDEDGTNG